VAQVGSRADGSIGLDSLLVGFYEGKQLQFAGKVRAGFIPLRHAAFLGLRTDKSAGDVRREP